MFRPAPSLSARTGTGTRPKPPACNSDCCYHRPPSRRSGTLPAQSGFHHSRHSRPDTANRRRASSRCHHRIRPSSPRFRNAAFDRPNDPHLPASKVSDCRPVLNVSKYHHPDPNASEYRPDPNTTNHRPAFPERTAARCPALPTRRPPCARPATACKRPARSAALPSCPAPAAPKTTNPHNRRAPPPCNSDCSRPRQASRRSGM